MALYILNLGAAPDKSIPVDLLERASDEGDQAVTRNASLDLGDKNIPYGEVVGLMTFFSRRGQVQLACHRDALMSQ